MRDRTCCPIDRGRRATLEDCAGATLVGEVDRSEAELSGRLRKRGVESEDVEETSRRVSWSALVSVPGVTIDGLAYLGDDVPLIQRYKLILLVVLKCTLTN